MNGEHEKSSEHQQRLEELLVAYLEAVESGDAPDQKDFLEGHPEFADELAEFFAGRRQVDEIAAPIREVVQSRDTDEETPFDAPTSGLEKDATGGPRVGTRVRYFGDYELLEEIARGGMGVVYKARQVNLKRVVALKMILAGQLAGRQDVQRFRAEAEAAAKLDHPAIVPIYEVGEHEGQHYFSMAFVDGESLARKVAEGVFQPQEAAAVVRKVAQAIAYAHVEGVIHRDLKPANVLMDQDGQPRVTDFGLAKRVEAESGLTATGQVLGTPSYMPPEQAAGKTDQIGPLSDVYSLGAILYCLLTGRPPFQAANPIDTLMQVIRQEPVSPRQLNAAVPRDLETICLKCLEKSPTQRYASARELADELGRFLDGVPIYARPVSTPAHIWRWCKRNPVVSSLAAGLAVAIVVGFVGVTSQWFRAEKETERAEKETQRAVRQEQLTRRHLYAAYVNLAQEALEVDNVPRAVELLEQHRPAPGQEDLRSFEWHYLWRRSHGDRMSFRFNDRYIHALALSPDGKTLACGELSVEKFRIPYTDQRWDERGKLVTVTKYNTVDWYVRVVKLWDVATGSVRATWKNTWKDLSIKTWNIVEVGDAKSLIFSRDGKTLAWVSDSEHVHSKSGSGQRSAWRVSLWDVSAGKPLATLDGATLPVALSPDGKRVAASWQQLKENVEELIEKQEVDPPTGVTSTTYKEDTYHRATKVWDTATGKELLSLPASSEGNNSVVFSPDGKLLAVCERGMKRIDQATLVPTNDMKLLDVATGNEIATLEGDMAVFSSNGQTLAFHRWSSEGPLHHKITLWDVPTRRELVTMERKYGMEKMAFSPDGKALATWCPVEWPQGKSDRLSPTETVQLWDVVAGKLRATLQAAYLVRDVAFSPDGKTLAVAAGPMVTLWDAATGEGRGALKGHIHPIDRLAFWPDGGTLLSASETGQTAKLWRLPPQEQPQTLPGHDTKVLSLAFSSNGRTLASIDRHELKSWPLSGGQQPATLQLREDVGRTAAVAFSRDGATLAFLYRQPKEIYRSPGDEYGSDILKLVEVSTHTQRVALKNDAALKNHPGHILPQPSCAAFSPDGKVLAIGRGESLVLRDLATGKERIMPKDPDNWYPYELEGCDWLKTIEGFSAVAFSPDGRRLATADGHRIVLWDVDSGAALDAIVPDLVADRVAFSPDGSLLAAWEGDDERYNTITIWNVTPDKLRQARRHFTPGREIISLRFEDISELPARTLLRAILKGHSRAVRCAAFSPDGKTLASGGADNLIKIWDVVTGEERLTLRGHADQVTAIAFSPDGMTLASGSKDGQIKIWRAAD